MKRLLSFRRKKPAAANSAADSSRLEAFSDSVIAIIITVMVLGLRVPQNPNPLLLLPLWPIFLSYGVSFFFIAIYWINHHHVFHFVERIDNPILWANIFFLFCLSLIPFSTAYAGQNGMALFPTMLYAAIMMLCSFAFLVLRIAVARSHKGDIYFHIVDAAATQKNWLALAAYTTAIPLALLHPIFTIALIFFVGLAYVLPSWDENPFSDKRG